MNNTPETINQAIKALQVERDNCHLDYLDSTKDRIKRHYTSMGFAYNNAINILNDVLEINTKPSPLSVEEAERLS